MPVGLARHHGLKAVYLEGLTKEELADFNEQRQAILDLQLVGKEHEVSDSLLQLGAAVRVPGLDLLPLDGARLHAEAKPVRGGKVQPDAEKVGRRRDAMVRAVLAAGNFGLIVLGASHDLSDTVRRQAPGCEYVRVWVKHLPE